MKRIPLIVSFVVVAALIAGCAPMITVQNNASFPVRVIVTNSGRREVLSPSPGYSSTTEAAEGAYRVTAIPDAEWIEYAKLTRQVLNEQLANADKLTGPQLLEVIRRLKEIAIQMQQYESAARSSASCGGKITSETDGYVEINTAPDGSLTVVCK